MVPGFAQNTRDAVYPSILVSSLLTDVADTLGCPADAFASCWQQRAASMGTVHLEASLAATAQEVGVPVTPRAVFRAAALMRASSGPVQ